MTVVVVMIMMMIMMISGQSNLTTGRIAAAHGWFNRIHQAGPPETTSQTASPSVQPFLQGSLPRQTYRPCYSICNK